MYDPQELLRHIDNDTAPILIGFTIAMLLQTIWLVDAARIAAKDKLISIPLFCTYFWFVHDLGCAIRYNDWFNTYDHWFMKAFWVGLVSAVLVEFFFIAQILKYGRKEIAPNWTQAQFTALIAAGFVFAFVTWEYLRWAIDDPLYFAGPAPTMVSFAVFGTAMYRRRGGAAGQTALMWQCFTAMTVFWWGTVGIWFTGGFRSWQYISMGVLCFSVGLPMSIIVGRDRRASKASPSSPAPLAPERTATVATS